MADEAKVQQQQADSKKGVDDAQIRQESGRAADEAVKLQNEAWELRQAAHGAADAEERQKYLEQAIDKEIAAESFGKTAKYMRSGTFQGMAVGAGLGVAPAATLGTLTGTLVGGLTSLITGGLGAGIGALTGAVHGPFWNMGQLAGKGIQKVTGNWWSRGATDEQKQTLEKMMHQANDTKMPDRNELESMKGDFSGGGKSWIESAKSMMPTLSWFSSGQKGGKGDKSKVEGGDDKAQNKPSAQPANNTQGKQTGPAIGAGRANSNAGTRADDNAVRQLAEKQKPPQRSSGSSNTPSTTQQHSTGTESQPAKGEKSAKTNVRQEGQQTERKKPRKLQVRSDGGNARPNTNASTEKKKPRKLETRS